MICAGTPVQNISDLSAGAFCGRTVKGMGRALLPNATPSGSAIGVLVVMGFGSSVVISRPLPPRARASGIPSPSNVHRKNPPRQAPPQRARPSPQGGAPSVALRCGGASRSRGDRLQADNYPPAHYLSAIAVNGGGCLPPHPRCCAVCVPLRAVLRPRGYPLRNVSPALPRLVTCLPPFPHPLPPFPPRTPRVGTTIGKVRFCRLSR